MTHVQTGTSALDADCCLLHQHTVGIEDVDGGDAVFVALHQYLLVGDDCLLLLAIVATFIAYTSAAPSG